MLYVWASLAAQTVKRLPTTWETWVRSLGREDALEKEMATHFSIHAWRIPRTKEPGGLQSMGSHRVGRDWTTPLHSLRYMYNEWLLNRWSLVTFLRCQMLASQHVKSCCNVAFSARDGRQSEIAWTRWCVIVCKCTHAHDTHSHTNMYTHTGKRMYRRVLYTHIHTSELQTPRDTAVLMYYVPLCVRLCWYLVLSP